jgi:hypothetical protein
MSRSFEASYTDSTDLGNIIPLDLILLDKVLVLGINERQHQPRHKWMKRLKGLEGDIRVSRETVYESSIGGMSISIVFAQFHFIWGKHFPDLGSG